MSLEAAAALFLLSRASTSDGGLPLLDDWPVPEKSGKTNDSKWTDFGQYPFIPKKNYTWFFRRNGTDRQHLETLSLKIYFRSERITAIMWKTTAGPPIECCVDCIPFRRKRQA
uniref:Secreted protein n=1 Tax=Romanomermis culicivorax TaxID=13658 RepID=A0A915HUW7_ROMCU